MPSSGTPTPGLRRRQGLQAAVRVAGVRKKGPLEPSQDRFACPFGAIKVLGDRNAPAAQVSLPSSAIELRYGKTDLLLRFRQVMNGLGRVIIVSTDAKLHFAQHRSRWSTRLSTAKA